MAEGEDEDPKSSISPKELKQTLRQMDPDKPPSEVVSLLDPDITTVTLCQRADGA